jgi:hypothetical protein
VRNGASSVNNSDPGLPLRCPGHRPNAPGMAVAPCKRQQPDSVAVSPTSLTVEQVVHHLVQMNLQRVQALHAYQGARTYRIEYKGFPGDRSAEMAVKVKCLSPGKREFVIQSTSGSKLIIDRVLKNLLEAEEEQLDPEIQRRSVLNEVLLFCWVAPIASQAQVVVRVEHPHHHHHHHGHHHHQSQAVAEGMLTAVIFWTDHDVSGWLAIRRSVPTERTDHSAARPQELAAPSPPIGLGSSHTISWDPVAPDGGGAYVETPGPIRNTWNWNRPGCFSRAHFGHHHDPSTQPWKAHWPSSAFRLFPLYYDLCFDRLSAQAQILLSGT